MVSGVDKLIVVVLIKL